MGTCSGPCFPSQQSLLLPILSLLVESTPSPGFSNSRLPRPTTAVSFQVFIFPRWLRLWVSKQGYRVSSGLPLPPASASLAAPPCPSLESFGWNQMPIGQSSCCLALHSIQTSKPGASLGPSDLLWAAGQSPDKSCLFSCCACARPGLHPRE